MSLFILPNANGDLFHAGLYVDGGVYVEQAPTMEMTVGE